MSAASSASSSSASIHDIEDASKESESVDNSTGKRKPLRTVVVLQRVALSVGCVLLLVYAVYQLSFLYGGGPSISSPRMTYDGKTQTLFEIPRDDDNDMGGGGGGASVAADEADEGGKGGKGRATMAAWLEVLRHGHIERMDLFTPGLADKWLILFKSGHQAVAKPCESPHHFTSRSLPLLDFFHLDAELAAEAAGMSRAQWHFQGWSEIASFYIDRVVGWHRKPPTTGRLIDVQWAYMHDYSWRGWLFGGSGFFQTFNRWLAGFVLPSTSWIVGGIPVSVQAWVDDVRGLYLSQTDRQFLTNQVAVVPAQRVRI